MERRKVLGSVLLLVAVALLYTLFNYVKFKNQQSSVESEYSASETYKSCRNAFIKLLDNPIKYEFAVNDSVEDVTINQQTSEATWYSSARVESIENRHINVKFICVYNYSKKTTSIKLKMY